MSISRSASLNVMITAAQKAGRRLVRDFGEVEQLQVSKKGPSDFVSIADKKAEEIIHEELQKARPDYSFLLEENGEIKGKDTSNTWIVDPLDGTTNFLHGIPHFAVSIGLVRDNEPFAGVVYNPISDELYTAEKGGGAFLNNRRLRVSGRNRLDEAVFATGIPYHKSGKEAGFLPRLAAVMSVSAGVRRFGAASLDLAYTAAGRYDGFWETGLSAWDIAAGIVIVKEAGGFITDMDGGQNMLESGDIIAANPDLIGPLTTLMTQSVKKS